ncbi:hypothetical protein F5J12DRAFT_348176 [Pisolithus orientalis]|uniref:uncharacterized protein n=1 Tax=Pisolithus orientalis TaxID=936130 RepID=UPI0022246DBB|nr:uncharacterized protein F5J12DRAFT_560096 [Pisolithus orientalis]XP_051596824.1 uncharacterized protein F5J12DRAFT_348176 [Pisolithus orientalis]KAI5987269.1 hypothetical protein F5J12DRAFT_560096 [Pisolithus orientalis]KAI5996913.1 hypothetical protein F5J12DRAFT_348176 [Pisolithus orientalis]
MARTTYIPLSLLVRWVANGTSYNITVATRWASDVRCLSCHPRASLSRQALTSDHCLGYNPLQLAQLDPVTAYV